MRFDPSDFEQFLCADPLINEASKLGYWTFSMRADAEPPSVKFGILAGTDPAFLATVEYARTDMQDQSPSAYDLSLAIRTMRAGWTAQEIVDLLVNCRRTHGVDLKLRRDYYARTLTAAEKSLGKQAVGSCPAAQSGEGSHESQGQVEGCTGPPELDAGALYGLAGDIVLAIAPHTEADKAALLTQFLTAFGSVCGRHAHFIAEADHHYTNVFMVLVGDTSKGRKGSSWGHVKKLFRAVDAPWQINSGLSSGEGLIWQIRDAIWKKEYDKKTKESTLVCIDEGIADKRLMVLESEFVTALNVMARDGNTLSPVLRNAWDHGDLHAMTKNSPAKATGAHISIIGHITREELSRRFDETEANNGLYNRFAWFWSRRSKYLPEGSPMDQTVLDPLSRRLREAIHFARGVSEVRRDEQAREIWRHVYPSLSDGRRGLLGKVLSRAEAQTMRFALIYALLDLSLEIRREHLHAALALWSYADSSARYIFGDRAGDVVADQLLKALREHECGLTRSFITRDLFDRNRSAAEIDRALRFLQQERLVHKEVDRGGPGRPTERWFAVTSSQGNHTTARPGASCTVK
jgi:hypothetical protein